MQAVEKGKDKVKKICEALRKQTLEPAMEEAERIIADARVKADQIILEAEGKAEKLNVAAEREIDKRKTVFEATMQQGARQAIETLKQQIEERLLNQHLGKLLSAKLNEPEVLAKLISALVKGIEQEGIEGNLSAYVSSQIEPRAINELLTKQLLEQLREKSVSLGSMKAGVELKLHNQKITLDLTDEALKELVGGFIRKDLREFLFGM